MARITGGSELTAEQLSLLLELTEHKYALPCLVLIQARGEGYKRQLEQELRASQKAINQALIVLEAQRLVRSVDPHDGRKAAKIVPTPRGQKMGDTCLQALQALTGT